MRLAVVCLRRFSMVICALGTIALGIVLVWALIRPGVIQSIGTAELAGVAGALLAPCLALAALRLDRRVARRERIERAIEEQLLRAEAIEVRDLTEAEIAVDEATEAAVEEMSPVIARIFHEGEVRRLSPKRHSRPGSRVTAG